MKILQKQPSRGEHPCRSVISINLHCNFIEITLRHVCSPVNLLYIFRTPFLKNTSGWLLLIFWTINVMNFLYTLSISCRSQMFLKINIFKNFAILLKRDSDPGVFLWILRNSLGHLFYRTPPVAVSDFL